MVRVSPSSCSACMFFLELRLRRFVDDRTWILRWAGHATILPQGRSALRRSAKQVPREAAHRRTRRLASLQSLVVAPLRLRFAPRHPSRSAARSFAGTYSALPLSTVFACCCHVFALSSEALRDVALRRAGPRPSQRCHQADAEVTQGNGLNVTVRLGELETLEHNVDKGLQRDRLRWRPQRQREQR